MDSELVDNMASLAPFIEEAPITFTKSSHWAGLKDYITGGGITSKTTLVNLAGRGGWKEHDLVRVSVGVACDLLIDDIPLPTSACGCHFTVRFDKLAFAPILQLECDVPTPKLKLCLGFHFNDHSGSQNGMQDFEQTNDTISFSSHGATSCGFNLVSACEASLDPHALAVIEQLRDLRDSTSPKQITLLLRKQGMASQERDRFEALLLRIPGGTGPMLSSIGAKEYSPWRVSNGDNADELSTLASIKTRLSGPVKDPMMPLECANTFSTLDEAAVQLTHSVAVMDAESEISLRSWAAGKHFGRFFKTNDFLVIGMKFGNHKKLDKHYKPPKELECKLVLDIPGVQCRIETMGRLLETNPGIPHHDAYFRVTDLEEIPKSMIPEQGPKFAPWFGMTLDPHINSFTFDSQLRTMRRLISPDSRRWHAVLLNQRHEDIPNIDMTKASNVPAALRSKADAWLRSCIPWNAEQLEVIDSITRAKGGLEVIAGSPGTGKTTLMKALTLYWWTLGVHVLLLAPGNKKVHSLASGFDPEILHQEFSGLDSADFDFLRLLSCSRELGAAKMSQKQAEIARVGHEGGGVVLRLQELVIALDGYSKIKGTTLEHGVVPTVIRLADSGRQAGGSWQTLRKFINKYREGSINMKTLHLRGSTLLESYHEAYKSCVRDVIRENRVMMATTGNVHAKEMREWWNPRDNDVVVLIDEASKDLEVNTWGGIVCEAWGEQVRGVFLFGDDKQLGPVNTCVKNGHTQFNSYCDRLDIALLTRLIAEGWPAIRLKEQYRMHSEVADFLIRTFHQNQLRNGPGTSIELSERMPGLKEVLNNIIATHGITGKQQREDYLSRNCEKAARLHYIEVKGRRVRPEKGTSSNVPQHVDCFFGKILPGLLGYFATRPEKMFDKVMVLCAYGFARDEYTKRINEILQARSDLKADDMPRVETVDKAQGLESMMVFLDGSFQHRDVIGFLKDEKRSLVALSRAQDMLWIIGGAMDLLRFENRIEEVPIIAEYRMELVRKGQCHRFN